ncbi:octanoyltransferase [Caldalkalibacillus thermarum]|uniref:lipoyl(octanoyl) transferase LipB n=1 Tax=Caldalkalibacillus thermarum TaxID=296745 RepID=UPI00166470F0|nr:lipoyl(octanoyl) transferase LipB [Caldalkalibacillus thermarum]GGK19194.1 octanoyltransferase [Caldalkalibacillus thermarum]
MNWNEHWLETHIFRHKQPYDPMWDRQKEWVAEIDRHERLPSLLLLEHDHVYTFGRGGRQEHLLISEEMCKQKGIELANVDRGGDITYHGPGQLVGYPLILLKRWKNDAHLYLRMLEETIIKTLARYDIDAGRKPPYTGVWVGDEKIAAIGVKFNRGRQSKSFITSHGFALNVNTDLSMFEYIIPCGIREYGVTSMAKLLDHPLDLAEVMQVYQHIFVEEFQFEPHGLRVHEDSEPDGRSS